MPACFFGAVGSVERRPCLLAVDDVVLAVAQRCRAERGQVRSSFRLGESLAPPDVHICRLGEELLLQLLRAERRDDRSDHGRVESQRLGHRGQLHLVEPDVALHRGPVPAAELLRPMRNSESVRIENPHRGHQIFTAQLGADAVLLAYLRGNLGGEESTHLVTKCGFLFCQGKIHEIPPLSFHWVILDRTLRQLR